MPKIHLLPQNLAQNTKKMEAALQYYNTDAAVLPVFVDIEQCSSQLLSVGFSVHRHAELYSKLIYKLSIHQFGQPAAISINTKFTSLISNFTY